MSTVTQTDAETLATKLAGLELNEAERALLDTVFSTLGDEEVAGFQLDRSTTKFLEVTWTLKSPRPTHYTEVEWTYLKGIGGLRG